MADIRLITLIPANQVQGVQQSTQGASSQVLGAIANLHPGTVLSGFVINRDVSGNPVLRTEQGDVAFKSNFFLKIGSEVVLRIEQQAGNTLAHILSVNGLPPEVAETQSAFADTPDVIVSKNLAQQAQATPQQPATATSSTTTTAAATQTAPQPSATQTLTGTVISTPPATAPQAPPTGTQITVNIVSLQSTPTAPAGTTPQQAATPTTPANTTPPATTAASYAAYGKTAAPTVTTPATPQTPLPVNNPTTPATVAAPQPTVPASAPTLPTALAPETPIPTPSTATTVVSPQPTAPTAAPVSSVPAPVAVQPGQTITATVIANEPSGEVLLQSPAGIIRLPAGTSLPLGSTVTLEIANIILPAALPAAAASEPAPLPALARQWGSLQSIFSLLANSSNFTFASSNLPWIVSPQGDSRQSVFSPQSISSGLMLFISALRGGDFRNWIGDDVVRWMEDNGHGDLIKKAEGEFAGIARQFTAPPPQQPWQSLFFPVAVAGEVQQARLFVKRDKDKKSGAAAERQNDDTRFIVEIDLSQLGQMQMDGFVRRTEKQTQFDLIIRSHQALPEGSQQNILQIYNEMGELTGYKGSIVFQSVKEFPVNPMQENIAHAMGDVVA